MYSEEEARKKQCRVGGMISSGGRGRVDYFPLCIASDCMGWLSTSLPIPATFSLVSGNKITEAQSGKGYCGYSKTR